MGDWSANELNVKIFTDRGLEKSVMGSCRRNEVRVKGVRNEKSEAGEERKLDCQQRSEAPLILIKDNASTEPLYS
jgi:hypothetical protein